MTPDERIFVTCMWVTYFGQRNLFTQKEWVAVSRILLGPNLRRRVPTITCRGEGVAL